MVPAPRMDSRTLTRFQRFSDLPHPKLQRLASAMSTWRFERRERIYVRNESSRNLYFLLRGVGKLSGPNKMNELVLMALLGPGDAFGISALTPESLHQSQCDA